MAITTLGDVRSCKFCGAIVAIDGNRAYHALPTCEGFRKAMEAGGGTRGGNTLGIIQKISGEPS